MDLSLIFTLVNLSVLPAWALLILAPRWSGTRVVVHSMFYPLMLGGVYFICMILAMGFGITGHVAFDGPVSFSTLEGVRNIFGSDIGILIGWSHYLVFDLFIGAWEARDAQKRGFSHWLLIPCLLLTFIYGPIGLMAYLGLRLILKKGGWALHQD